MNTSRNTTGSRGVSSRQAWHRVTARPPSTAWTWRPLRPQHRSHRSPSAALLRLRGHGLALDCGLEPARLRRVPRAQVDDRVVLVVPELRVPSNLADVHGVPKHVPEPGPAPLAG